MDIKHPHDSFFKQLMSDTKNFYSVDISLEKIGRIAKEGGIENMPSLAER
jgi:hypothetical protein